MSAMAPRVLVIDNYDSFTYNLYQYLSELGAAAEVVRNDAVDLDGIRSHRPTHIVLSPGPGHPERPRDFGVCADVIAHVTETPVLGVCLGHQGIAHHLGGRVVRAPEIVHGKTDDISHDATGLFAGLPTPLTVMRYHSLVVDPVALPEVLRVTARNRAGLIMGLAHRSRPLFGVQFHPESIGTPEGHRLLANFLAVAPGGDAR